MKKHGGINMKDFDNEEFYGTQLIGMGKAYISVLTFNKIIDLKDFARLRESINERLKGRKLIQILEDNRKQILIVIFDPIYETYHIDNTIRQIIGSCSPNLRVSF